MNAEQQLKLFHFNHSLMHAELDAVEKAHGIDLGRQPREGGSTDQDQGYYLQFEVATRQQAASMAHHYELFYCLENSIRQLVSTQLEAAEGADWWNKAVPDQIKRDVSDNIKREQEAGVTLRSLDNIDYTTFGQLSNIIDTKWDVFADSLNNRKAAVRIMAVLNLLRAPIAHCSPLAADEVVRLKLALADWFRLME